ncbi:PucR family transcriptional regulator [Pseudonocardia spinosispora]|uniref:PucR family transcriptional regulator n=1 Tax=Pseudonocardia spinosispora TaxID=103441 RepID=UPI00048E039E|nr:helix-turn-helix domain-containing protein [Pseudonocardia spinosispora]
MRTDNALGAALAARLAACSTHAVDSLTELVGDRIDGLGGDEVEREWVRSSVRANIELVMQVMAHPDDVELVEPPLGGVALARRIAQHDVPFYELVRAYHLAEWFWVRLCMRELAGLTTDVDEYLAHTVEVSSLVHTYIDQVCRRLSVIYEDERERWRSQEESARIGPITALLTGAVTDVAEAEAGLGYRLGHSHLAVIVWFAGRQGTGDEFLRIKRVAAEIARRADCRGRPLVVARDHTTLWVWLPLAGQERVDVTSALEDGVRVALGEPARGLDGFVASHRQASAAHEIGLAAGPDVGAVFPYREVSSLAFLSADLPRARTWVAETLGELASSGRRTEELRRTLRTYSAANRSATATARLMNCHKNTIQYRIRSAERLLGHSIESTGLELDLALLACHWLGDAVTPPS